MDIVFFQPCQPDWICKPFLSVFSLLLIVGLVLFIRIVYREYLKIKRVKKVRRLRRVHYRDRKGGNSSRPNNAK
ncbi:hypothetical protein [Vibrio ziniensis]|uniref:Uncharacterized protein n=1 Tax=Vibrio ziniensis TaxID=2711221 RepID=A0A6G7CHS0_9VIBR|nr:hypothetical protein [Vibrio ziniensis]QIH41586.1 hypothetical protein G5S32_06120 [Vibrio ziniensis]